MTHLLLPLAGGLFCAALLELVHAYLARYEGDDRDVLD